MKGQDRRCEVIKIGDRLRIVDVRTNRTIDNRGYMDLEEVRREYPGAI